MVVDDDNECLESLASALRLEGFSVKEFAIPYQALNEYSPQTVDIVITDYGMPDMNGLDLLREIQRINKFALIIVTTGESQKKIKNICLDAGASAFFYKPLNIKQVIAKMRQLVNAASI